jgi:hypothetical protein
MERLIERRGSERTRCNYDILHNTAPVDFFYKGRVLDYSGVGLYFESNEDMLPGDEISILIRNTTNNEAYYLDVKIQWYKELQGSKFKLGYGASLKHSRKMDDVTQLF